MCKGAKRLRKSRRPGAARCRRVKKRQFLTREGFGYRQRRVPLDGKRCIHDPKAGVHRSGDPAKLFVVSPYAGGTKRPVEDITCKKHQVRLFGIDQADPAGKLRLAVVIPHVKVDLQDHRQRLLQRSICLYLNYFTVFMMMHESGQETEKVKGYENPFPDRCSREDAPKMPAGICEPATRRRRMAMNIIYLNNSAGPVR